MSRQPALTRWALSLALILGLHIGIGVLALNWRTPALAVERPPAALQIALAPLPSPAPVPAAPAAHAEPTPLPPPPVAAKPRLVVAKAKPKAVAKPTTPKVEPSPAQPAPTAPAVASRATNSPPTASPAAAAPASSPGNPAAKSTWQSRLLSHLARYKRYPEDARRRGVEGTSQVRFHLDAAGNVLSVSLAASSGNAALDRATLAMIRRAAPLPQPPAELLSNGRLEIVAPFVYSLERS